MRIIAGKAKGTRLVAPKGHEVRPTLDRVREALFSILTPRLESVRFLDLFAGTGANGIEALSRGAEFCTFVDNDARSLAAIQRNLAAARLAEWADVCRLTLPIGLATVAREGRPYDIIFADPPYAFAAHSMLLEQIRKGELLVPDGLIVVEHSARSTLDEEIAQFHCFRRSIYGDTALSFFS